MERKMERKIETIDIRFDNVIDKEKAIKEINNKLEATNDYKGIFKFYIEDIYKNEAFIYVEEEIEDAFEFYKPNFTYELYGKIQEGEFYTIKLIL